MDDARWEVRLTMLDRPGLSATVMMAISEGTKVDDAVNGDGENADAQTAQHGDQTAIAE